MRACENHHQIQNSENFLSKYYTNYQTMMNLPTKNMYDAIYTQQIFSVMFVMTLMLAKNIPDAMALLTIQNHKIHFFCRWFNAGQYTTLAVLNIYYTYVT